MSKFSKAFGASYDKNKLSMLTRTFQIGNQTMKVRVPFVHELEAIYGYANNPDEALVEKYYQALIPSDFTGYEVEQTDNDTIINGQSLREAAKSKVVMQYRITEYFKLLVPDVENALDDLEYADIEAEYPLSIQLEIVEKINEAISPDYKEARGK